MTRPQLVQFKGATMVGASRPRGRSDSSRRHCLSGRGPETCPRGREGPGPASHAPGRARLLPRAEPQPLPPAAPAARRPSRPPPLPPAARRPSPHPPHLLASAATSPRTLRHSPGLRFRLLATRPCQTRPRPEGLEDAMAGSGWGV